MKPCPVSKSGHTKRDAVASIAINMTSARLAPERLEALLEMLRVQVSRIEETINPLEGTVSRTRIAL